MSPPQSDVTKIRSRTKNDQLGALFGFSYLGQPIWIFWPSNKYVGKVVPYLIPSGIRGRPELYEEDRGPRWVLFCQNASERAQAHRQVPQAGFELWLTHMVRTHPTTTNPILVRPPSAPNGLTRRGITSKNTFLDVSKDAIAGGLSLSRVPWMEMLVFAAMVALYGGLPVTFTRVTRLVLVPIMYSIHGHPPPTVIGWQLFFKGSDIGTRRNDEILEKTQCLNTAFMFHVSKFFSLEIIYSFMKLVLCCQLAAVHVHSNLQNV